MTVRTASGGPSLRYRRARGLIKSPPPKRASAAYTVYFVKAVTIGLVKIGKADCVRSRFRVLRTTSPDTLMLLGCIVSDDGTALERDLHRQFAAHRSHGEWFKPSDELLAYISAHASTPPPQVDWRESRRPQRTACGQIAP
jgi:hypothetical protein